MAFPCAGSLDSSYTPLGDEVMGVPSALRRGAFCQAVPASPSDLGIMGVDLIVIILPARREWFPSCQRGISSAASSFPLVKSIEGALSPHPPKPAASWSFPGFLRI